MNRDDLQGRNGLRLALLVLVVLIVGCASTGPAETPAAGALTVEEIEAMPEPESGNDVEVTVADPRAAADEAYRVADYEAAARHYLQHLRVHSGDVEAWFRLSNAYAANGRLEDAVRGYQVALELDPAHARARHNYGLISVEVGIQALLEARRDLPRVDAQAEGTMNYLNCLMATLRGRPQAGVCGERRSD